jgi:hypothetical protein
LKLLFNMIVFLNITGAVYADESVGRIFIQSHLGESHLTYSKDFITFTDDQSGLKLRKNKTSLSKCQKKKFNEVIEISKYYFGKPFFRLPANKYSLGIKIGNKKILFPYNSKQGKFFRNFKNKILVSLFFKSKDEGEKCLR